MASNESFDANNMSSSDEALFRTFKLSMYSSVFILSMAGNIMLICAICKFRKLRTVPNFLVLNLSICDLLVVVSSIPFQMAYEELGFFPFGRVGCKILWPVATGGINAGVLTLVAIAVERFKAITAPMSFRFNKSRAFITILLTHAVGLSAVIPYSLSLQYSGSEVDCLETWSRNSRQIYTLALFLLQYAIPLPVIITLYSCSWNKLRHQNMETIRIAQCGNQRWKSRSSESGGKFRRAEVARNDSRKSLVRRDSSMAKRLNDLRESFRKPDPLCEVALQRYEQTMRTLKMFIAVVVVFAVCALPNQITWLWTDFSNSGGPSSILSTVFYFLTYTNSVFNPWIYGGFNPSFRQAYKTMIYNKGLLPICRLLRFIPAERRNTDTILYSKTDFSGVYRLKNSHFDFTGTVSEVNTSDKSPPSMYGSYLLPPQFITGNERNENASTSNSKMPPRNGSKTEQSSNSHCLTLPSNSEKDEKVCYLSVPETSNNLQRFPDVVGNQADVLSFCARNEGHSSIVSVCISDTSSVTSMEKRPRQVSFIDEQETRSAPATPDDRNFVDYPTVLFLSEEDLPRGSNLNFLSTARETDC